METGDQSVELENLRDKDSYEKHCQNTESLRKVIVELVGKKRGYNNT